jgi:protein SCO1
MQGKSKYYWLLLVPVFLAGWYVYALKDNRPIRSLPFFAPKNRPAGDTALHRVGEFSFINQDGKTITGDFFRDKIYVAEFFFTTCEGICPIMNRNLQQVYNRFRGQDDLLFLSHTVEPENDSVPVLKTYAGRMGADDGRWQFVTGDKRQLYRMARKAYLLDDGKDPDSEDFVHTQTFALVDHNKRLRGFYDGTDSLEINRLVQDIEVLLQEKHYHEKKRP